MELVPDSRRGLRVLLTIACLVIVVAGLREAKGMLLPVLVALFLALLAIPPLRRLQSLGVPAWAAAALVVLAGALVLAVVTAVVGTSVAGFAEQLPVYRARLDENVRDLLAWLGARGIEADQLVGSLNTGAVMELVSNTAVELLGALSNLLLVVLVFTFILLEAQGFPNKLRRARGKHADDDLSDYGVAAMQVQKYLATKAWVSLATGIIAGLLCWAAGVDFPLLWALVAFLFNFVPAIGSAIAAVPPALLALVQFGPGRALVVAAGYVVINVVIGNIIEPKIMGRRMGLSTLVVFLSLLFWGWIWGPVGMLLSVPLTVVVKIMLEHSDDFRWVAVLLGPAHDEAPPRPESPALPPEIPAAVGAAPAPSPAAGRDDS
jgi:AI-2 transport protein TqsA